MINEILLRYIYIYNFYKEIFLMQDDHKPASQRLCEAIQPALSFLP